MTWQKNIELDDDAAKWFRRAVSFAAIVIGIVVTPILTAMLISTLY